MSSSPCRRRAEHGRCDPAAREDHQGLSRRPRRARGRFRTAQGRDPRPSGRERRRQVDADEDDGGGRRTQFRADVAPWPRDGLRHAERGARGRHRDGLPGDLARALDDGGAEPLSRLREIPEPAARHLHLGPAIPAIAELPGRSGGDGRDAGRRQEADGRDRPRRPSQRRGHHLRRADRDADPRGKAPFLRADPPAEGARRVDRLHLARARGGARPL